jgi:hypothetical protein
MGLGIIVITMLFFSLVAAVLGLLAYLMHMRKRIQWWSVLPIERSNIPSVMVYFMCGVTLCFTFIGWLLAMDFIRRWPRIAWYETRALLEPLFRWERPPGASVCHLGKNLCVVYWLTGCGSYASQVGLAEFFRSFLRLCFTIGIGFVVLLIATMAVLAYLEYTKHVEAKSVVAHYDVKDLADPSDLGEVDERTPLLPSPSPDEVQRKISNEIDRIYGKGSNQDTASVGEVPNQRQDSTSETVGRLQRLVSQRASELLRTAPPPRPPPGMGTNPQAPPPRGEP